MQKTEKTPPIVPVLPDIMNPGPIVSSVTTDVSHVKPPNVILVTMNHSESNPIVNVSMDTMIKLTKKQIVDNVTPNVPPVKPTLTTV